MLRFRVTIYRKETAMSNFCKQCGKEIPEGRKFCNSSCAAKYNNVRKFRKPWTEEQKQRIRKKKYCKYCGVAITREENACVDCLPYAGFYKTFLKAGIFSGNLRERYQTILKQINDLYFTQNRSLDLTARCLGIHRDTVRRFLFLENKKPRNFSEASLLSFLENRRKEVGPPDTPSWRYLNGHHTTWEGIQVYYRSSYELEFAKKLDEQKIRYRMEDLRIRYFDSKKKAFRVAVPDFHLLDSNELVEIKSTYTFDRQNMLDRFVAYREKGYGTRLILDKQEVSIG